MTRKLLSSLAALGAAAVVLAALAATGAAATPVDERAVQPGSIAFIRNGDVWLASGDLSRQYRVTFTGGYSDVSQADNGALIALKGIRLHRLSRTGKVLANFATPVSDPRPAPQKTFYGPFDPALSPDGTRVAYSYYYMTQSQDQDCYPPRCYTTINEGGTGYSRSNGLTGWDTPGFAKHSGWRHPIWVDNQTLVLSNPTHLPNADVIVDQPATRPGPTGFLVKNWFSDEVGGNPGVDAGDVSRDKTKMAFLTGSDNSTLTVYRVRLFPTLFRDGQADPASYPDVCYRYSGPKGGRFASPTFSPDGSRLAVAESDGVHVVSVPPLQAGCTIDGASPTTGLPVLKGAREPDWGPASLPPPQPRPTS